MVDGPGERLPGAPASTAQDRIILHVDMDCFYAACERLREPALRDEPVVVGMGYEPGEGHGAVATASYEAREYGVESAQAISTALSRLPRKVDAEADPDLDPDEAGYYRPVDMDYYAHVASDVADILHDCADVVRKVSIDEAYLDVTDLTAWSVAEGFARHVKDRIAREVGVTASVGVAPSMSTAKIASDHDKPDGLVVVEPQDERDFLAPLPIEDLHGIGPVTARELREDGIQTIGDLADADESTIRDRYGDRGRDLLRRARGEDDRAVTPVGRPKSLSRESAFAEPTADPEEQHEAISRLAAAVADRATRRGAMYRTIGIKVVEPPYDVNTRERSLPGPVDEPPLVTDVAVELLEEFEDTSVRKLGVRVANLSFADQEQAKLDGWDDGMDRGYEQPVADETERSAARDPDSAETASGTDDRPAGTLESRKRRRGQARLPEYAGRD